jgi:hypothetical protein
VEEPLEGARSSNSLKGPQYRLFGKRRQRTLWRRARAGRELRSGTTDGRHVDELVTDVDGLGY